jgi:[acyl-carrier-protein] S-malonyltransferase
MNFSFLFPGQGSQHVGMGQFLYNQFDIAKKTFDEASESLGIDMTELCFKGPEEALALTENTQPALLTVSIATERVIQQKLNLKPVAAAGHSIGEYAALVSAGVIDFKEAVKAVRIRGQAMQSAVPVGQGGMLAVLGLENHQVEKMCSVAMELSGKGPVSPANFNSPGQVVISGSAEAIEWIKTNLKPEMIAPDLKKLRLIPLQVSAPFHCAMMKPAEEKMREILTQMNFKDAQFPIIQNFTAKPVVESAILRENLIRQVSAPVLWTQCIETMREMKATTCIELGAGKVLAGLVKKIDSENFKVFNVNSLEDLELIGNL